MRTVLARAGLGVALVVLAACLLVTVLRLLQPGVPVTPLLVGFAPLTLPVYAVAVIAVLVRRSVRRAVRVAVGLPVAAALVLHLAWLAPTYATQDGYRPDAAGSGADDTVRVLSINAKVGRADPAATRRLLDRVRPDVLVVSEVTGRFEEALEAGGITDLPLVAGQEDSTTRVYSVLPAAGDPTQLADTLGWRAPLQVDGDRVQLYGVHPVAPHISPDRWRASHRTLAAETARVAGPSIIAGDLNATLDHGPVIRLQQRGFTDAARAAGLGWAPTWPTDGRFSPVRVLALDHVMARGAWTLVDLDRDDLPGTDHQAVWATWRRD